MKLPDGYRRVPGPEVTGSSDDIDDEIRFHIACRVRELVEEGLGEVEAGARAEAEFGSRVRAARAARRQSAKGGGVRRMSQWIGEFVRDVRHALRLLGRNPGFATAALVTLTLGIGGTVAIFSVVDSVLLRPFPYPDEERVIRLWPDGSGTVGEQAGRSSWSVPDLEDWRERSSSLSALGAYTTLLSGPVVSFDAVPVQLEATYVTSGFFEALGTPALLGTGLPAELEETDPAVAVISEGFWRREFGADPSVVGTTLQTQGGGFRIVGVMPAGFDFPTPETEIWTFIGNVSQGSVPWLEREVRFMQAVGRVAPEVSLAAARSELAAVARGLASELPETNGALTGVELMPVREAILGDVRLPLLLASGAVFLTLLIGCANVANLLLARGAARAREFSVRTSLGASGGRIARQVLSESLVLGLVGGVAGVGLAFALVRLFRSAAGELLPRTDGIGIDGGVLTVALLISIATSLLFGSLPALRLRSAGATGDRGSVGSRDSRRLLDGLVFGEVALAAVLLIGGGLLMRSFSELRSVDPGFEPEGLLVAELVVSGVRYPERPEYLGFRDRLLERVEAIPGVRSASTVKEFPTRGEGEQWDYSLPGEPEAAPGEERSARAIHVEKDFFEVMGIPLLAGRGPGEDADLFVIINERLARDAFGTVEAAEGRSLMIQGSRIPVRGVVGDVLHTDPSEPAPPVMYIDDRINARRVFALVVRTQGEPLAQVEALRSAVGELDPQQPLQSIYTARTAYSEAVGQPRLFAYLIGLFALVAMTLAAVGIYGVIAYSVRRRTREIGVRMALGADRSKVRGMVVRETLTPVLPAVLVGLALAAGLSGLLSGLLFQVGRVDPLTYLTVGATLVAVALAAAWPPAREATRIDPLQALRTE